MGSAIRHLTRKSGKDLSPEERAVIAWAALLDFGFEFCLGTMKPLAPAANSLETLRNAYRAKSAEHLRGNVALLRRLADVYGQ